VTGVRYTWSTRKRLEEWLIRDLGHLRHKHGDLSALSDNIFRKHIWPTYIDVIILICNAQTNYVLAGHEHAYVNDLGLEQLADEIVNDI
jgi:hypothetical protein